MKSEKIKKFWNIANGNEIILDGYISETSWYEDEAGITPKAFKKDLESPVIKLENMRNLFIVRALDAKDLHGKLE